MILIIVLILGVITAFLIIFFCLMDNIYDYYECSREEAKWIIKTEKEKKKNSGK